MFEKQVNISSNPSFENLSDAVEDEGGVNDIVSKRLDEFIVGLIINFNQDPRFKALGKGYLSLYLPSATSEGFNSLRDLIQSRVNSSIDERPLRETPIVTPETAESHVNRMFFSYEDALDSLGGFRDVVQSECNDAALSIADEIRSDKRFEKFQGRLGTFVVDAIEEYFNYNFGKIAQKARQITS